jgi:hypothetical protein
MWRVALLVLLHIRLVRINLRARLALLWQMLLRLALLWELRLLRHTERVRCGWWPLHLLLSRLHLLLPWLLLLWLLLLKL